MYFPYFILIHHFNQGYERKKVHKCIGAINSDCTFIWFWWRAPHSAIKQEAERLCSELRIPSLNINDLSETKISATSKTVLRNNLPISVNINRLDHTIFHYSAKVIADAYVSTRESVQKLMITFIDNYKYCMMLAANIILKSQA